MSKKVKKWEPETATGFAIEYEDSNGMLRLGNETCAHNNSLHESPVRIIREKDYKRLLRLAHKKESRNG